MFSSRPAPIAPVFLEEYIMYLSIKNVDPISDNLELIAVGSTVYKSFDSSKDIIVVVSVSSFLINESCAKLLFAINKIKVVKSIFFHKNKIKNYSVFDNISQKYSLNLIMNKKMDER